MTCADVTVQFACDTHELPAEPDIAAWIDLVLAETGASRATEVAVRIVDEDEGQALNKRYRDQDKATNVLSFPAALAEAFTALDEDETRPLGDLVLCAPVVSREAARQGKAPADHWAHLLVHGTLHLLGYGHRDEAEAVEMEALEARILARRGVDNPYRERDSA